MSKERGVYHLHPALPTLTNGGVDIRQLTREQPLPHQEFVQSYATELFTAIQIYQSEQNTWVQKMGGKSYSEIAAISQYMFLTFVGARSIDEVTRFARSPFARISHLVWRIVAGIDDAVDTPGNGPLDISQITDTDGVPVTRMIRELIKIPCFSPLSDRILAEILKHTQRKETNVEIGFEESFRAKKATTGTLTAMGSVGAYLQLGLLFPQKTFKVSPKMFSESSVAGSLIAQLVDDIVDLPQDIGSKRASSLVLAAARDSLELPDIEAMIKNREPVNMVKLLNTGLKTGIVLSKKYQELRLRMVSAPLDLRSYSDHQFYFIAGSLF